MVLPQLAPITKPKRGPVVLTLVMDAVGIPTLNYILECYKGKVELPNLTAMGLGCLIDPKFHNRIPMEHAFANTVMPACESIDSVFGHREMCGLINKIKYPLLFDDLPKAFIEEVEKRAGIKIFYNKMAGGDVALEEAWREHEETGAYAFYRSSCDPAIQIIGNEDICGTTKLNEIAEIGMQVALEQGLRINRVITRPYKHEGNTRRRTPGRHDVTLPIEKGKKTLIDILVENGIYTASVAKIREMVPGPYNKKFLAEENMQMDKNPVLEFQLPGNKDVNRYALQEVVNAIYEANSEVRYGTYIFVNLVETDSVTGHPGDDKWRSESIKSLQQIDKMIDHYKKLLTEGDVIIVTADHGIQYRIEPNPGYRYGYHHKEEVPVLAEFIGGKNSLEQKLGIKFNLGNYKTLASVGHLVAQRFGLSKRFVEECGLQSYFFGSSTFH